MRSDPEDITQLLSKVTAGDREAQSKLISIVYDELHRLASYYMRQERPDHTLQPTALVHEAFLKLFEQQDMTWENRKHFFAVAAQVMRRILVDHARTRNAQKRGAGRQRIELESAAVWAEDRPRDLLVIDEALTRLADWDARQCQVVELRFFGGLSIEETAEVLGVSTRTIKRDWTMARAWLHGELSRHDDGSLGTPERVI